MNYLKNCLNCNLFRKVLERCCKNEKYINKRFLDECKNGNVVVVKDFISKYDFLDFQAGMMIALEANYAYIASAIAPKLPELDSYLRTACEKGYAQVAEFLVQAGANPKKALAVVQSNNIRKMLYRYIQKTEMIN